MASVADESVLPAPLVAHRPWWRGKLVQVAGTGAHVRRVPDLHP